MCIAATAILAVSVVVTAVWRDIKVTHLKQVNQGTGSMASILDALKTDLS